MAVSLRAAAADERTPSDDDDDVCLSASFAFPVARTGDEVLTDTAPNWNRDIVDNRFIPLPGNVEAPCRKDAMSVPLAVRPLREALPNRASATSNPRHLWHRSERSCSLMKVR